MLPVIVEHFREQLHYQGYGSDFYQVDEVEDLDWDAYRAVVCYRCSREDVVCKVVEQAKKTGLNVYYDIDDLIFDYERISYLHFLTGSEYKDFKKTTEQIHPVWNCVMAILPLLIHWRERSEENFRENQW